ncbi:tripartite motif-containing protein 75-like [Heterodontus francisci]|uniref:tripartite motif-containing protein 75-like n=1 Tax=Heterodontus francisci TaxID=7792 RepID=UPI00355C9144
MAAYLSDDEDGEAGESLLAVELLCCVCMDLYRDPMRLPCEHSFCSPCIEEVFAGVQAGSEYRCPVCREPYQNRPVMSKHLVLVRLVEAYRKTREKRRNTQSGELEDQQDVGESALEARDCRLHCAEKVTHLCFEEWALLCPQCVRTERHRGHTTKPLGEVSEDWKKMVPNIVESLEESHAKLSIQILQYAELEDKAKEEISNATEETECEIDHVIEFLQNEKERIKIDIQHVGKEHLDTVYGLQAEATDRLEECANTILSFKEAANVQDELPFVESMMHFMQRMETLVISPDEVIAYPSLNLDRFSLPSVLRTWVEEEEEDDDDDEDDDEDSN